MPKDSARPAAVIYARVSHAKQVAEGHGIDSQTTRCREFAARRGYDVVSVFTDDMTGRVDKRPGMEAMLRFVKKQKGSTVVLIDDISRLARDVRTHWNLRDELTNVGAVLESPTIEFGESPDDQLVENMLASVSQHFSQKNGEVTFNRMRSRMLNGYWTFKAPLGYRYDKHVENGPLLVPDEPVASILKEGLEGYASGRFASQSELAQFFESKPDFMSRISPNFVRIQMVKDLLTRLLYAGYIEYMKSREGRVWNVPFRKGKHQGLIDLSTFERIQERLSNKSISFNRRDTREDFPLRGYVACEDCGTNLTANWSTGRRKSYPYYLCQKRGCPSKGKSIPKKVLEDDFSDVLRTLEPSEALMDTAKAMFRDAWEEKRKSVQADKISYRKQIKNLDKKIDGLIGLIANSNSPVTTAVYEKKIEELVYEKEIMTQNEVNLTVSRPHFDQVFEHSMRVLGNPYNIWKNSSFSWQRAVLRLVFSEPIKYKKNEGYRTPKTTFPFKALEAIRTEECEMVPPHGLEPRTY